MTTLKGLKEENHVIISLRLAAGSSKEISRKGKGKDTHPKRHKYIIERNEQSEISLADGALVREEDDAQSAKRWVVQVIRRVVEFEW